MITLNPCRRSLQLLVAFLTLAVMILGDAYADESVCGVLANWNDFGPYDYRDPANHVPTSADPMGRLKRVENVHFRESMKSVDLKRYSVERLASEFVYTLRVFPNHPEALYAIARLEKLASGALPQGAVSPFTPRISADCFFDRALRFTPDDPSVHFIYAIHLHGQKKLTEARNAYQNAADLGLSGPNFHYNFGLLLTETKEWALARKHAVIAYESGFPLEGLRRRLRAAGYPVEK